MSIEKAEILKIDDIFKLNLSIPNYQRPYKWTIKNVQQLIDDLLQNFREGEKIYRIGTIVLNKDKDRSEIVDGQQRLITLSLLLHKLGKEDVSLLEEKPNHSISKNNITTNYNFLKNYNFTNEFKDYLLKGCEMVCIELDNLDEAFQFFDSQNARGKPLESYDLLKAYHLRDMRDKDEKVIHQCVERWEKSAMSNDINNLDKIINYILFRLRRWHYKENAEIFTSDELDTFKGVHEKADYPYLHGILATHIIQKLSHENPFLYRSISAFQSTQVLINGKYFFDYIEYYTAIYARLFREENGLLSKIHKIKRIDLPEGLIAFLNNHNYSYRVGDKYIRNLFECTVLFYFDKFGESHFEEFITKAFLWTYRTRVEYQRITFKTIEIKAHDATGLISYIERSITPEQVMRFIQKTEKVKFSEHVDNTIKEILEIKDENK